MDSPLRLIANNPLDQLARTIEALLVVASAPLSVEELAEAADDHTERVEAALGLVRERYTEGRSGIVLEHVASGWAFRVGPRGGGGVRAALREACAAESLPGVARDARDHRVPRAVLTAGHRSHPRRRCRLCGREPRRARADHGVGPRRCRRRRRDQVPHDAALRARVRAREPVAAAAARRRRCRHAADP